MGKTIPFLQIRVAGAGAKKRYRVHDTRAYLMITVESIWCNREWAAVVFVHEKTPQCFDI